MILKRPIYPNLPYFKYEKVSNNGTGIITQLFGENLNPLYAKLGLKAHNGLDYRCPDGYRVYASHDGKVERVYDETNSSPTKGYGVYLRSSEGFLTVYWHFKDVAVKYGQEVKAGELIGHADNTGQSTGTHLHFGLYPKDRDYKNGYDGAIDPMPYFEEFIININLMKIIGDKKTNKQYILGKDGYKRWIYSVSLLNDLDAAGAVDKNQVEWLDNTDKWPTVETWALIK